MEQRRREQRRTPGREQSRPAAHQDQDQPEGVEPDFTDEPGTTDPGEAAENAEPYFPPTDPVVQPSRRQEGTEVVGGFSSGAMDETGAGSEPGGLPGDEEIRLVVLRELREDALTIDLQLDVEVQDGVVTLRGTVATLDEADAAADAAARVNGVTEVLDETEVAGPRG